MKTPTSTKQASGENSRPQPKTRCGYSSTDNPPSYTFNRIAKLIGHEKTIKLQQHIKHRHFGVRREFDPNTDPLVKIVGRPAAYAIQKEFAGELLSFTPLNGYHDEAARLVREGLPITKVARRFHVNPSRILAIIHMRNTRYTREQFTDEQHAELKELKRKGIVPKTAQTTKTNKTSKDPLAASEFILSGEN